MAVNLKDIFSGNMNVPQSEITLQSIRDDAMRLTEQQNNENAGLFIVKPASEWIKQAKTRPIPKMLFGQLWFENELCILFADTNLGKSILAVQIGNSISKGEAIKGFALEAIKQPVLYFDFELSDKQFEARYSDNFINNYLFDRNFIRVEINPNSEIPTKIDFETYLNQELERTISNTDTKVIIIDNLTYLRSGTETAKDALPLMKHLKALKAKYNLSVLVLAHTPKRDLSKPITRNDLQGSKMLINFCDSSFAIGESFTDKHLRYIKQIKQRNCELIYDADNVGVCEIAKPSNFLQFEFVNYATEKEHLKVPSDKDKERRKQEAAELKAQGKSNREIARQLGVSEGAVRKWLKQN
ncbi:MAG: AAA family ATPase [Bacteroidales bacterium]|jgi:archaellum biogenesis ATPase FlaH|nr:AAA family ATPase [Bacteroidales bacterium]